MRQSRLRTSAELQLFRARPAISSLYFRLFAAMILLCFLLLIRVNERGLADVIESSRPTTTSINFKTTGTNSVVLSSVRKIFGLLIVGFVDKAKTRLSVSWVVGEFIRHQPAAVNSRFGHKSGPLAPPLKMAKEILDQAEDEGKRVWLTVKEYMATTAKPIIEQPKINYFAKIVVSAWSGTYSFRKAAKSKTEEFYNSVPHGDLVLTALGTVGVVTFARRASRRFRTAQEIPLEYFRKARKMKGIAVAVNDADNLRFFHRPAYMFWRPSLSRQGMNYLKHQTINVRLAGIDAPELAHFGEPSQPYAKEAMAWLTNYVAGRHVTIFPHRIDQYFRAVASVHVGMWPWRNNVSLAMVKAGFATVYESAGAEYGGIFKKLKEAEAIAKKKRIGMWKQDKGEYTSPAEFKRNNRLNATTGNGDRANNYFISARQKPKY